ncbi:MAG TPA: GTPase domain-containing protein [Tepidisphaeraceae bacterium]|nr:GTPase domain-containing protein [Tepidisphaeraceae bacterium]
MTDTVQQLVAEVAEVTGAELPAVLDANSPALEVAEIPNANGESFYLIGLIGGKDVGKSALVNALVGDRISASSAYGPGTESAIAYVHQGQVNPVRALLEREAPGRHQIVVHNVLRLHRQVLLDLPDIDSVYGDHVELTRRMLRHMLFPVWVQSIEKYADQQPQRLLAAVAEGNDPANFLFCLNKCDQLWGEGAVAELRDDYAQRLARTLGRPAPPKVYLLSATRPDLFDFAALKEKLSQQKTAGAVKQSIELAGKQRDRSMLAWLESQRLPERVQRVRRLEAEAQELTTARLAAPLFERAVPGIVDDPAHRAAIVDEVMTARVARWPIVNVIHTLLSPLTALWRTNVGAAPSPEALVLARTEADGRTLSAAIQATFSLLQQTHPMAGNLYRQQKLWEAMPADAAASDLRRHLVAALDGQRAEAVRLIARRGVIAPIFRWLLTVGALLWFPLVQPVLEVVLRDTYVQTTRQALLLAVQLLGATYLLKSAGFLAIWFLFLWLILRWDTQRRVTRLLARWRATDGEDNALNLPAAVMAWVDELLDPIHVAGQREEALAQRTEQIRQELAPPTAA